MDARISLIGNDVLCESNDQSTRRALDAAAREQLTAWTTRYRAATVQHDPASLVDVGSELFAWLDEDGWASAWARGVGDRVLEIAVDDLLDATAAALLDLPWETLFYANDFLAGDPTQLFVVYRSIGRKREATPLPPRHRDLALMFMAASPRGQVVLDYEGEESAILEATERQPVQLFVEESGCVDFLKERMAADGPFEALHLSCHGHISKSGEPELGLETPTGQLELVPPGTMISTLGAERPPLVFLSACHTAEAGADKTANMGESFVRGLIRGGVPNVLGWDGSVYDTDAIAFARRFYHELAAYADGPYAAAAARRELLRLREAGGSTGEHWHLARFYAGPEGGGPVCGRGATKRALRKDAGYKEFLDTINKRVPVATVRRFVGRRRQAQDVLAAFRAGHGPGVLIHGMGNLGKSSLAARIANRLPRLKTVVIYGRYDASAIFDAVTNALPPRTRRGIRDVWAQSIREDGSSLGDCLEELLSGPLDQEPILLIIDDLEQVLATPRPGQALTPLADAPGQANLWRESLIAVLNAFDAVTTDSRLLLTSRYDFTLPGTPDPAAKLVRVQLPAMDAGARAKLWRAAVREDEEAEAHGVDRRLIGEAVGVAGGNPGLQEILCRPLLRGEEAVARKAIEMVRHFQTTGEIPAPIEGEGAVGEGAVGEGAVGEGAQNAALEFFQRVAFGVYRDALTPGQAKALRALTLFGVDLPIPGRALLAVIGAPSPPGERVAGKSATGDAGVLARLMALGLVDDWAAEAGPNHAALNPLARPLAGEQLDEEERSALARAALGPLAEAWQERDGNFPRDERSVELTRLALIARADAALSQTAAYAAGRYLFDRRHDATGAWQLLEATLGLLQETAAEPAPGLLRLAAECAERIGETTRQIELLEQGLTLKNADARAMAQILVRHAEATQQRDGAAALASLRSAVETFESLNDVRERAVAMGQIADILQQRGETDEALRIRMEEELPVYERLNDVRERAVTMGKIADILQQRGETDEALRIRMEEQLPVCERALNDVRERAVTMGQIADILQQRGETDEALRIRMEEQLPVYERLNDVRERAVTMGQIADILQQRGETDEALRIRREEELPVYERLNDVRSRAVTMGKIADILQQRGETDEALRIRMEEQLPVYERLNDVRSRAVTMGKIADILQQRARPTRHPHSHGGGTPVRERLNDVRSRAVTMGKIADILQQQGETDEALRIRMEEQLPVYERLNDVRSRAVTMGKIADILQQRARLTRPSAFAWRRNSPVYERLNDVRSRAVTMGQIADILQQRARDRRGTPHSHGGATPRL
ncbi:MAG: CHAT domain-containing protein [Caldilineaceae bacterium]|nr:CHAT domain-containing protein [Caldilineaceae bacterium]